MTVASRSVLVAAGSFEGRMLMCHGLGTFRERRAANIIRSWCSIAPKRSSSAGSGATGSCSDAKEGHDEIIIIQRINLYLLCELRCLLELLI